MISAYEVSKGELHAMDLENESLETGIMMNSHY
jgi:hypothetical protein